MFEFNYAEGATMFSAWGMWFVVFAGLFLFNEFSRRQKWAGFFSFVILPIILTIVWMTVLKDVTYTDWFHLAKVYSATAGCIGFWCIRHIEKKDKITGEVVWRLADNKIALCFPPLILAINIIEAVARDIEVGSTYWMMNSGAIGGEVVGVMGGPWNYMNAAAGILNIIAITGWFGIVIRKQTKKDKSKDMLWPDMLWFWIIAYDLWNFVYTYNCIPTHSWYAGLALLIAPTLCAFTVGKGAWLQHRAQTLAIWCMFAQTFPNFQDTGMFVVKSTYNTTIYTILAVIALASNIAVFVYMIYKIVKTKRNPYKGELYIDLDKSKEIKMMM
ncbi:DUF5692 family protein [Clostridium algidicarnis]|uniref:DUF5692 family protein n=1 Tax=Clostridium algidicarnis TaxID=37659 RepID=UPI0004954EDE|nr:DUF5692 family protein [Clostridium algidicarnis]MBB6698649.1 hypothetical protein [Clostridium algidicarnis]MBU3194925.1 hypothetical protein [Clostridium algidicarnis]MBU3202764.1 hypothetical protein [Clostridium algidicarnis]MBU3210918.1 hypothetical protein [Clostridium algidicarnis]MBU3222574.1 hypothetical protein [Clostridium algidicarnis]